MRQRVVYQGSWLLAVFLLGIALALGLAKVHAMVDTPRQVTITAMKFTYSPARIMLKKGQPVILVLSSKDRLHGFHVPALKIRADVLSGREARVQILPDKVGRYAFQCDIFCGAGHSGMSGEIIVTE